jgi:hypothetical protein
MTILQFPTRKPQDLHPVNLLFLSVQRVTGAQPTNPTNEQRAKWLRRLLPHQRHNTFRWPFNGSQSGGDPSAVSDVPAGCRLLSKES